ncbi:MAG: DNA replication/repair protein RecF [Clostridia bacterium]|nr:DNA replication/repair protein RecF [Clostridia bacterium]
MNIKKIEYENFRNLSRGFIEPSEGVNVIYGENAQGKTNLLEAIWIFTGGRSFRSAKDLDLIKFKEQYAKVNMKLFAEKRDQDLKIEISKPKRKTYVNEVLKKSPSDYVGKFCSVIFSPSHLSLIKEGPGCRRKFLDTTICQMYPMYAKNVTVYNHILNQRNQLLKSIKKQPGLIETLFVWNEKLAKKAAEIVKFRIQYVNSLKESTECIYRNFTKEKETLRLHYYSNAVPREFLNIDKILSLDEMASFIIKKLESAKQEELFLGYTLIGPHRDDFEVYIDDKKARSFASQGQQRSAVLSLKLAEAELIKKICGKTPVILLDDVMSELDANRQDFILNSIHDRQVFITCCEPEDIGKMADGKTFEVKDGKIY